MFETLHSQLPSSAAINALGGFTQGTRLLRLTTPLGADVLLAECVRGEEGLSQGYKFRIAALSTNPAIPLKSLIGQPVLLELLTANSRTQLRPFHGHITEVELTGANGGFARYHLTVEPWLVFLALGRDSRVFQDMTVFDILDTVFAAYQGKGRLAPAWRYDLIDRSLYTRRSLCTQYQESDFAFAERLMYEEGLFHYFEHSGDAASPALGRHIMVIADHNGSFKPNAQTRITYAHPSAVMKQDSMDRWQIHFRHLSNAVELCSWDYRTRDNCPVSAVGADGGMRLVSRDTPGAYAYASRAQGERIAERQLQAIDVQREVHTGAGTVRTVAPGTTFFLDGEDELDLAPTDEGRRFLITRTVHLMHNNLSADLKASLSQRLGQGPLDTLLAKEEAGILHTLAQAPAQRPLYRCRIDAIRSQLPYRSSGADGHGQLLHPRPTVVGQQTAIVVGPPGAVIHTDRDHRIKVQFHWQRGTNSHSRLEHPSPDGHTGAPGTDQAGTWVRVVTGFGPVAGANWGSHTLPRVGQEVLIDFQDGNIDRPVAICAIYNGRGQVDAPHNQVHSGGGAATGNAPAWFPGTSGAHAHPAALSGIKTQAMQTSQLGTGAYNQLVFDDSPGQPRVALQSHAGIHQGTAELNLGHLRHQSDNQRLAPAGFGAELKTAHSVAVRAGQGLLLSTDARAGASGGQMDAQEAIAQIEQGTQLQTGLAELAQKHNAGIKDGKQQAEAAPDKLPAIAGMAHSAEVLNGTGGDGDGAVVAYTEPQLQLSSPAGISASTAANAVLVAGNTTSVSAGQDINLAAQGSLFAIVKSGISIFTYGKANKPDKPNQETGIRLHAASGKVSVQSQSDETRLTAAKAITVASVTKGVTVAAKKHVMMTAGGALLKLEGGNIDLHGPGTIDFKATVKEFAGPASSSPKLPLLPRSQGEAADQHFVLKSHTNVPISNRRYRASTGNQTIEGFTDAAGRSALLDGYLGQLARFELVDTTHDEHFIIRDPLGEPIANMSYKISTTDGIEVEGQTDDEGHTVVFTSDKVETVELLHIPVELPPDDGVN